MLCNFQGTTNMIVSITKFTQAKGHKATWIFTDQKTYAEIDHILVSKRESNILLLELIKNGVEELHKKYLCQLKKYGLKRACQKSARKDKS